MEGIMLRLSGQFLSVRHLRASVIDKGQWLMWPNAASKLMWSWILGSKVPYLVMVIRSSCSEFRLPNSSNSKSCHFCGMFSFPFFLLTEWCTADLSLTCPSLPHKWLTCAYTMHCFMVNPSYWPPSRALPWPKSDLLVCIFCTALWSCRQIWMSTWTSAACDLRY